MNSAITAIEFGTTKLVVLIGRSNREGLVELLGLGSAAYGGIHGDRYKSLDAVEDALAKALEQAQKMAGLTISHCILGVPNEFCGLIRNIKTLPLNDSVVTKQHIHNVEKWVTQYPLPQDWVISQVIHGQLMVDGYSYNNPLGVNGLELTANASLVCIHRDFISNITRLLSSFRIKVHHAISVPVAYGKTFLTMDERDRGAVLVDVGGYTTDIVVYKDGLPIHFDWLPVGGTSITMDIVKGLGIQQEEAEKLKRNCVLGLDFSDQEPGNGMDISVRAGKEIKSISSDVLQNIIEARIEELLELVRDSISEVPQLTQSANIVITGGGIALLRGVRDFSVRILNRPVKLGVPDVIGLSSPTLSSAYALVQSELQRTSSNKGNMLQRLKMLLSGR